MKSFPARLQQKRLTNFARLNGYSGFFFQRSLSVENHAPLPSAWHPFGIHQDTQISTRRFGFRAVLFILLILCGWFRDINPEMVEWIKLETDKNIEIWRTGSSSKNLKVHELEFWTRGVQGVDSDIGDKLLVHIFVLIRTESTTHSLERFREGVRFKLLNDPEIAEYTNTERHLLLNQKVNLAAIDIAEWIAAQQKIEYNLMTNNCIHFVFLFAKKFKIDPSTAVWFCILFNYEMISTFCIRFYTHRLHCVHYALYRQLISKNNWDCRGRMRLWSGKPNILSQQKRIKINMELHQKSIKMVEIYQDFSFCQIWVIQIWDDESISHQWIIQETEKETSQNHQNNHLWTDPNSGSHSLFPHCYFDECLWTSSQFNLIEVMLIACALNASLIQTQPRQ